MKSQSYSYSSSSTMFSNGKQKIMSGKSHKEQTINNQPTRTNKSFVKLVQHKNKTKGLIGSKKNQNPWKIVKLNSYERKPRKPRKPQSLRKGRKGKTRKS
jgi:hypothetical protein